MFIRFIYNLKELTEKIYHFRNQFEKEIPTTNEEILTSQKSKTSLILSPL